MLLVTALVSVTFVGVAVPQKRGGKSASKSSKRRVPTAREAGSASVKKVQLRKQLRGVQGQMKQVKVRIHQAKAKEHRITDTIETVNARIERTQSTLGRVRSRLRQLGVEHDEVVQRLDETQARLAKRRALLARRVRDNYQRGEATYLHVLLQSRSLHELLSRDYYVRHVVRSDAELIEGVREDLGLIAADKRRLEAQQREQESLETEYEVRKADYVQDRQTQRQLLSSVQAVRHEAEDELDDLEEEAHAMTSRIRSLTQMLKRREEALRRAELERRRRAREKARQAQKRRGETPRREEPSNDEDLAPRSFSGGFIRPVNGRITSGFGYRYHPILHRRKLHTGVDFGASHGTPIRAAAAGTVLLAGYSGGYGKCVIIYHGDGVSTLYGHCSSLGVSEGQEVKRGQVIARVGSTGMSTGPHLHFEVRRNGTPVRPF
jgi:murein DD-endopeptidase MepM/ murein hydrolase activator NlpD